MLKKFMEKVDYKELDNKQKKMAETIRQLLVNNNFASKDRIKIMYTNLTFNTLDRDIIFQIYDNNYDYKEIGIKYLENIGIDAYYIHVKSCIEKNEYTRIHIATELERMIIDLIEKYKCQNIAYVFDEIHYEIDEDILIDLEYVNSVKFDKINDKVEIVDDDYTYTINFKSDTIEYSDNLVSITHNDELDVKKLENALAGLNKCSSSEYFIKNSSIYESDIKFNLLSRLCKLHEIEEFKTIGNEIQLNLYGKDTIFLTQYGSEM